MYDVCTVIINRYANIDLYTKTYIQLDITYINGVAILQKLAGHNLGLPICIS